jgi:hypothetical protein
MKSVLFTISSLYRRSSCPFIQPFGSPCLSRFPLMPSPLPQPSHVLICPTYGLHMHMHVHVPLVVCAQPNEQSDAPLEERWQAKCTQTRLIVPDHKGMLHFRSPVQVTELAVRGSLQTF